ncbi:hypothetical protein SAY87_019038 [Trapa incisa]|uniref:Uncharacterized protein n=1 Tax=Trapa incisa TaxID=236973 RepID=A0AAN7K1U4_9MYRT|nr:hypothetical protein SAY87_019038 [Trapa incisa]
MKEFRATPGFQKLFKEKDTELRNCKVSKDRIHRINFEFDQILTYLLTCSDPTFLDPKEQQLYRVGDSCSAGADVQYNQAGVEAPTWLNNQVLEFSLN